MVTIDQAMRGILRFFDTVASPHMDEVRSFVAGVGLSLLADGSKEQLLVLKDNLGSKRCGLWMSTEMLILTDSIIRQGHGSMGENSR